MTFGKTSRHMSLGPQSGAASIKETESPSSSNLQLSIVPRLQVRLGESLSIPY